MTRPIVVVVEGNIGSGKSTLLDALAVEGHVVFPEDVQGWEPFLKTLYETGNCDALQVRVAVDQAKQARTILHMQNTDVVFVERCHLSSHQVFVESALASNHISLEGYKLWQDVVNACGANDLPVDLIFYVSAPPQQCHERLKERSLVRKSETNVPLEYLQELDVRYDHFLQRMRAQQTPVIVYRNDHACEREYVGQALEAISNNDALKEFLEVRRTAVARGRSISRPTPRHTPRPVY